MKKGLFLFIYETIIFILKSITVVYYTVKEKEKKKRGRTSCFNLKKCSGCLSMDFKTL